MMKGIARDCMAGTEALSFLTGKILFRTELAESQYLIRKGSPGFGISIRIPGIPRTSLMTVTALTIRPIKNIRVSAACALRIVLQTPYPILRRDRMVFLVKVLKGKHTGSGKKNWYLILKTVSRIEIKKPTCSKIMYAPGAKQSVQHGVYKNQPPGLIILTGKRINPLQHTRRFESILRRKHPDWVLQK